LFDISVLRNELEKTGYLDYRIKGDYDYYWFDKKQTYLMLVDHLVTAENRSEILKRALKDLFPDEPTWSGCFFYAKQVIIVGRTTQTKAVLRTIPRFRTTHSPRDSIFQPYNQLIFTTYLIDEEKKEIAIRELSELPLTMPKRIKALDKAIQNYLQFLRQDHSN